MSRRVVNFPTIRIPKEGSKGCRKTLVQSVP